MWLVYPNQCPAPGSGIVYVICGWCTQTSAQLQDQVLCMSYVAGVPKPVPSSRIRYCVCHMWLAYPNQYRALGSVIVYVVCGWRTQTSTQLQDQVLCMSYVAGVPKPVPSSRIRYCVCHMWLAYPNQYRALGSGIVYVICGWRTQTSAQLHDQVLCMSYVAGVPKPVPSSRIRYCVCHMWLVYPNQCQAPGSGIVRAVCMTCYRLNINAKLFTLS